MLLDKADAISVRTVEVGAELESISAMFGLNRSFDAELSDIGIFDVLNMFVDPGVLNQGH